MAWLKGEVVFGSHSSISGLKLGDAGKSTHNRRGASNTTFTACRFRGGGGSDFNAPVIMLGLSQNSCDHITFTDCDIERNLASSSAAVSTTSASPQDQAPAARPSTTSLSPAATSASPTGPSAPVQ